MFVWPDEYIAYVSPKESLNLQYNEKALDQIMPLAYVFTREWVHRAFEFLAEESNRVGPGLRSPEAYVWPFFFRVFRDLPGAITEDELRQEIIGLLDDGQSKFRHQATFEICFALVMSFKFASAESVERTWEWLLPFLLKIFQGMLRPDNVGYWRTFLTSLLVITLAFQVDDEC